MDESTVIAALTALAQETRLAAFRHLVAAHPEAVQAGDIARHCKVPHNTMSSHLGVLARAGLISARRDGRAMLYRADLDGFRALVGFLTEECCDGRPEICAPILTRAAATCA